MNKDKIIFVSGIFIALIITFVSGFLYFQIGKENSSAQQSDANIKTESAPTVPPINNDGIIDYKNINILVLNGSGITGAAAKFAKGLTDQDYQKVTTGNYENIITGNLLFAPTDFGGDINLIDYKFEKSEEVKIVIGK